MGWGACERALKLHLSWKGLSGKARAKTGIGKSDLPGLQGGPRKRDLVFVTKCARLGSIPTLSPFFPFFPKSVPPEASGVPRLRENSLFP